MTKINVHIEQRPRWSVRERGMARGRGFLGTLTLDSVALAMTISACSGEAEFTRTVSDINGFFAAVHQNAGNLFAAVDHVRSFPLFYAAWQGRLYLSDSAEWIEANIGKRAPEAYAAQEFLLTGYVTGAETLNPNIKQLQAGELLIAEDTADGLEVSTKRYYVFTRTEPHDAGEAHFHEGLAQAMSASIGRLLEQADGRQLILPLSGGYDSRLLAALIKEAGYSSVLTFTYGRSGNPEAEISKNVAMALDLEWHFVAYDSTRWREWFETPERREYFAAAHGLASVPHIQDWPAVWSLKERGLLDDDAFFVPGHTGDFITGGHSLRGFRPEAHYARQAYLEAVLKTHYRLWAIDRVTGDRAVMEDRVGSRSGGLPQEEVSGLEAIALHDSWDWQERQAKFIVNSVRTYDYWGFEWWLPFWDKELVAFWESVPFSYRQGQRLYVAYVTNVFARVAQWDQAKARRTDRDSFAARFVTSLRNNPVLPTKTLRRIRNRLRGAAPYERHPMVWFGIVPQERFESIYDGTQSINSFLAAYLLYGEWVAPPDPRTRELHG